MKHLLLWHLVLKGGGGGTCYRTNKYGEPTGTRCPLSCQSTRYLKKECVHISAQQVPYRAPSALLFCVQQGKKDTFSGTQAICSIDVELRF